jgi:hypothetical protein
MLRISSSTLRMGLAAITLAAASLGLHPFSAAPFTIAPAYAETAEGEAFNSAKELGTVDAWQAYLKTYPDGFHADLARAYIKKLGGDDASAGADEPGMKAGYGNFPISAGSWGGVVRDGPGKGFPQQSSLNEGDAVTLLAVNPDLDGNFPWFRIAYGPFATKGYIWGGLLCAKRDAVRGTYKDCPEGFDSSPPVGSGLADAPPAPAPKSSGDSGGGFNFALNAPSWCHGGTLNGAERTICSDFRLSKFDEQMTEEFQMAVSNITSAAVGGTKADAQRFRGEQQAWLGQRNSCGTELPCLQAMYVARLKVMRAMNQPE